MIRHEQCFVHTAPVPAHAYEDHCTCGNKWPCIDWMHDKHNITRELGKPPYCDTCGTYFGPMMRLKK